MRFWQFRLRLPIVVVVLILRACNMDWNMMENLLIFVAAGPFQEKSKQYVIQ